MQQAGHTQGAYEVLQENLKSMGGDKRLEAEAQRLAMIMAPSSMVEGQDQCQPSQGAESPPDGQTGPIKVPRQAKERVGVFVDVSNLWRLMKANYPDALRFDYEALLADARQHSPEGIAGTIGITNPEVSMRARLKENSRPALLIQGVREKRFAPLADYARSNMPHLETAQLEAGHGLNMEVPEAFNKSVIQFIERNP